MGTWQLEVGKMAIYLAFPVGCFYWFNLPGNAEKYLHDYPDRTQPEDENLRVEFEKFIHDYNTGKLPRKLGMSKNENTNTEKIM